jgi:ADP-heptose:LPS heptosyltransferase
MKISPLSVKRIAVFVPNKKYFGANIVQIPFFQHLRKTFIHARITLWSTEKASGIIVKQGLADEICIYRGFRDYYRIYRNLHHPATDIVFNLRWFSDGINLLTGLSGARLRIGFATSSPATWFLNRRIRRNDQTYMALLYLDLLKPAGIDFHFSFDDATRLGNDSTLEIPGQKKIVCMMPGGGEGEHKRWGIENYCSLGELLIAKYPDLFLIFVLGPQEEGYSEYVVKNMDQSKFMILKSGSLADIVRISNRSKVVIANDCGPSHLAQLAGANYVGIWGWINQHPGQRIINWALPKPNSVHIVAQTGEDIKQIRPAEILPAAEGFIL